MSPFTCYVLWKANGPWKEALIKINLDQGINIRAELRKFLDAELKVY